MKMSSISECKYDEDHKMTNKTTIEDKETFVDTKVIYDEEGRVEKTIASIYFGNGMKKKHIGDTVTSFSYFTEGSVDTIECITEIENFEQKSKITKLVKKSTYDHDTSIKEETISEYNDDGVLDQESVVKLKDGLTKPLYEAHYGCTGEDNKLLILEKKYDEDTKSFTVTNYFNSKPFEIAVSTPSVVDVEGYDDVDIQNFANGQHTTIKFSKDVGKKDTILRVTKIKTPDMKFKEFCKIEEYYEKFSENAGFILRAANHIICKNDKRTRIESLNILDLEKSKTSTVLTENAVIINSTENKNIITFEINKNPRTMMNESSLIYDFDEEDIDVRLEYKNGELEYAEGTIEEDELLYNIEISRVILLCRVVIEVYDKNGNLLNEYKVVLNSSEEDQMDIFYNVFNLLVKRIIEKYGDECIEVVNQDKAVILSDKDIDFKSLLTRYEIMRR